ncbi:MAG: DNA-binding protein, partial [Eubacterium sp.]
MADGKLEVEVGLETSGFQKGLGKLKDAAVSGMKSMAVGVAAGGAAMAGAAVKAVKLASDLTEVQNVVDTTFGKDADKINQWAKDAATSFGMAELDAKKFNGTIGAMLKSMGMTGDEVTSMSTDMVGLAGDMASFYNLSHEEAFEKIRAGISGETEPLKQLGINMSVANLEAYALSKGITKT